MRSARASKGTEEAEPKPHYLRHRQRLRKRFLKSGLGSFHDYEAIELLLTLAIPRGDVKEAAKEVIARFGSFRGVLDAPIEELREIPGFGEVAPVALRIVREAANRYLQQKSREAPLLADGEALFAYCRAALGPQPNEVFRVIYLDSQSRIIDDETLAEGTLDRATIYPRRVMEAALKKNAAALVFAHNHPNGDVMPSEHDKALTRTLLLAAKTLQVEVLDHIIVSREDVFSFRQNGLL